MLIKDFSTITFLRKTGTTTETAKDLNLSRKAIAVIESFLWDGVLVLTVANF